MDGRDPPPPEGWTKNGTGKPAEVPPLPPIAGPAAQT
jgi:cell division protease FtsH